MSSLPLLLATGAAVMLVGLAVVLALEVRARQVLARLGVVPRSLRAEIAQQRTPPSLLAAYVLMLVQIPLFLLGTSFYSLLNLMTLGLSDAVYSAPRWQAALLLAVVLLLGSFAVPLALIWLARMPHWWALALIVLAEASVGMAALVGSIAHEGAAVLTPGAIAVVPILLLLLLPEQPRRHFELG